jgi:hypothetical protein
MLAAFSTCLWACSAIAEQQPGRPDALIAPREFLKLFDIDDQWLAEFQDGQPLDAGQRERMLNVLFRLRQYPLTAVDHFTRPADEVAALDEHPAEGRGELFTLRGRATRVEREEIEPALAERFGIDACYRCTIAAPGGQQLEVWALAVPKAWKLGQPIDEPCGAKAMFLKQLPADRADASAEPRDRPATPPLLFAAQRVEWYPDNALGKLGMDFGLLDEVRDRAPLEERECFYQMLAAARRADPTQLERKARQDLLEQRDNWRRAADDRDVGRPARNAARRALAAAQDETSDVVPLFNDPPSMRGRLVTLRGEALRAVEIRVHDPDIAGRFGIHHYYEVEIVTGESQNNPIVCCVAQLPQGMALGNSIRVAVRVTGFFLKSWAYNLGPGNATTARKQLAPLVIAGSLKVIPAPAAAPQELGVAGAVAAALAAAAALMWYIRRGDRRAQRQAQQARLQLPERIDDARL